MATVAPTVAATAAATAVAAVESIASGIPWNACTTSIDFVENLGFVALILAALMCPVLYAVFWLIQADGLQSLAKTQRYDADNLAGPRVDKEYNPPADVLSGSVTSSTPKWYFDQRIHALSAAFFVLIMHTYLLVIYKTSPEYFIHIGFVPLWFGVYLAANWFLMGKVREVYGAQGFGYRFNPTCGAVTFFLMMAVAATFSIVAIFIAVNNDTNKNDLLEVHDENRDHAVISWLLAALVALLCARGPGFYTVMPASTEDQRIHAGTWTFNWVLFFFNLMTIARIVAIFVVLAIQNGDDAACSFVWFSLTEIIWTGASFFFIAISAWLSPGHYNQNGKMNSMFTVGQENESLVNVKTRDLRNGFTTRNTNCPANNGGRTHAVDMRTADLAGKKMQY